MGLVSLTLQVTKVTLPVWLESLELSWFQLYFEL